MAIPGIPQDFLVQTGNITNLISWSQVASATSYKIERSLDNVTFSPLVTLSGSPLATSYLDSAVVVGTSYWYRVAASNISGDSSYTVSQFAVPTPSGEMSLAEIRLTAQRRADRENSDFVTTDEWNSFINQALYELYDLLVTSYEDYSIAEPIEFDTSGSAFSYPLPNGTNTFTNAITKAVFTPQPFYKLRGVDLSVNSNQNEYLSVERFNFAERNQYSFTNTLGALVNGVLGMKYRLMGNTLQFIPTPAAGQTIRVWYVPRLKKLLKDTDVTSEGVSGWLEYVIVRAAKYALDKEESDTTKLDQQISFLKDRIESSATSRDSGLSETISDVRGGE